MPKVSKIKLYLTSSWGKDYEVHYNAKKAPKFSIKGLPEDFTRVTGVCTHGFQTESELESEINKAVYEYKELKKTEKKVIVYKASATAELTMHKKNGHYEGHARSLGTKEQVMEWSEEREYFFTNIYSSMREMVIKISQFIDQEPEQVALLIQNNQKKLI